MTGNNFVALDQGRLLAAGAHWPTLRASGLDTFAGVMRFSGGKVMRSVPGRSTVRLELPRPEGGVQVAYLKRYAREYLSLGRRCLRLLRWPGAHDEAGHEWQMIEALQERGFRTASTLALGQERSGGIVQRSFLLTAEITGGIAAHDLMKTLDWRARRTLVRQIAAQTRRFHEAGFVHKDYYLSHLLVVESRPESEFFFIDLQRVVGPGRFRPRWRLKDLGALGYSAQLSGATRTDLLCFYKIYRDRERLNFSDQRFIRKVMTRISALHGRGPRYDVIWDRPGEHPPNV